MKQRGRWEKSAAMRKRERPADGDYALTEYARNLEGIKLTSKLTRLLCSTFVRALTTTLQEAPASLDCSPSFRTIDAENKLNAYARVVAPKALLQGRPLSDQFA